MARTIQKIISFATSESSKSFCLSIANDAGVCTREMYYGDIEATNSYNNQQYNKGCLRSDSKIYSSLYNVKDMYMKSAIYGNNFESDIPTTYQFQNTFNYRLSSDMTSQVRVKDFIYQLNNASIYGKQQYSQDIYSELSLNNGYAQMPNASISTVLFNQDILSAVFEGLSSEDLLSTDDIVKSCTTDIQYNQLVEIPGNIQNDFDSGNYAANTYTTKNQFNSEYDMMHNDENFLTNSRKYIAVDACNDQLYLKYYDNIDYGNDKIPSEAETGLYDQKCQRIEVVKALNRYESLNVHKTNYYDIEATCEKMFQSFNNEMLKSDVEKKQIIDSIKKNLKHEIANCIHDICKNLAPVDTQLVKVNVLESQIKS